MVEHQIEAPLTVEMALQEIVRVLHLQAQQNNDWAYQVGKNGANLWLPNMIDRYWSPRGRETSGNPYGTALRHADRVPFFDAAAELVRMGVLRPGPVDPSGSAYQFDLTKGFSLTARGAAWVQDEERARWIPPGQLVEVLRPLADRFSEAFLPRVAEAAGCHRAGQYMAACAMAGAAVECILLAVAKAKLGPEQAAAKYESSGGRKKTIAAITGSLRAELRASIETLSETVSYWRDGAAHGVETRIGEVQAAHALDQLLRLAQLVDREWPALAQPAGTGRVEG